ncbi:hypothetical protein [Xenorhabdus szentirmaii]|uniref:Uncharacterized protein n=1 Tax=Xenorhabdus szentirmaii DSM 16338 TaxID=1427518 RepID=W1IUQ0_9GAMM|nr:hypothetical protein [Xenorhabdus szentirmaii]PHM32732.1 hypothetical protein Xsze_03482 [Xenorhabdus szentirmaii DSM 16338]PHM40957.1 hypothetical protein Xszus_00632 [Xenorhabdus szentirmaii]CDL81351.1 conserved membrane hypothetical protein [Xenorhabdus szentirmaii DSM 16338]
MMQSENFTQKVVIVTLKSWRFVSGLSLFMAIMTTVLFITTQNGLVIYIISLVFALFSQYYCWRVWLDCHYFQLLDLYPEKETEFDQALFLIFNKKPRIRTPNDRFQGAIKLLKRAVICFLLQLLSVFLSIQMR